MWFHENDPNEAQGPIGGIDASLLYVHQLWIQMMPDGVLGFGQGAALASVMCRLSASSSTAVFAGLRFGIFLHGYNAPYMNIPMDPMVNESERTVPTFHAFSPDDSKGQELLIAFGGLSRDTQWHITDSSNDVTPRRTTNGHASSRVRDRRLCNAMGKYMVARKRELVDACSVSTKSRYRTSPILEAITEEDEEHDAARRSVLGEMEHPGDENQGKIIGLWRGDNDRFRSEGFQEAGMTVMT